MNSRLRKALAEYVRWQDSYRPPYDPVVVELVAAYLAQLDAEGLELGVEDARDEVVDAARAMHHTLTGDVLSSARMYATHVRFFVAVEALENEESG